MILNFRNNESTNYEPDQSTPQIYRGFILRIALCGCCIINNKRKFSLNGIIVGWQFPMTRRESIWLSDDNLSSSYSVAHPHKSRKTPPAENHRGVLVCCDQIIWGAKTKALHN